MMLLWWDEWCFLIAVARARVLGKDEEKSLSFNVKWQSQTVVTPKNYATSSNLYMHLNVNSLHNIMH